MSTTVRTIRGGTFQDREVEMTLVRSGKCQTVVRLFDHLGSETFDPTEATKVEIDGALLDLVPGDEVRVSSVYPEE